MAWITEGGGQREMGFGRRPALVGQAPLVGQAWGASVSLRFPLP